MANKRRSSSRTDRISNLPCNVIDDILKYLPLRDAAKTSILSREWQYKWLTIPYLIFDRNFKEKLLRKYNIESIIYQILLFHKGRIAKFTYEVGDDFRICWGVVDQWVRFLSNHHIEELTLQFSFNATQRICHHLFTFDQLRRLSLTNCNLKLPSAFKGFGRLLSLDLFDVRIEPEGYSKFISKCPMLEHLNLNSILRSLEDFEIDAPNLKSLCFTLYKLPSICLKNTSFLDDVSITLPFRVSCQINLIRFLGQLSYIKRIELNGGSLHCLTASDVPERFLINLSHLVALRCNVNFEIVDEVRAIVGLIRSSPNLQSLKIHGTTCPDEDMNPSTQFLKEQRKLELNLSQLENVKIDDFSGSKPEMEFVKLLLLSATALEKLELKLNNHLQGTSGEGHLLYKRLARFRRASSTAKIIT